MDLIYTNANRIDQGVLKAYAFDLSFGESENDFEMTLGINEPVLEYGSFVYIEGTEYGGVVDAKKTTTTGDTITYMGRTWHGVLNSKVIQPDIGQDHLIVLGEANAILDMLIKRMGLGDLFSVDDNSSGIAISKYQFNRYCLGYDGIKAMLASVKAKLKIKWENYTVKLSVEPIVDYTDDPVDGDTATLTVEHYEKKVNHLVCLGKGDLADREVIHLYVDQFDRIGHVQYFTGIDEVMDVYDNSNAENLETEGISKLEELRNNDKAEISVPEQNNLIFDIGDIVGANDMNYGISATATVSQKIVKINNGAVSTEYKTGGN